MAKPALKVLPGSDSAWDELGSKEAAQMLKALGHPARIELFRYLSAQNTCFFGDLSTVVPLAASTISQHLTILKEAGLILGSADEQRTCYCVNPARLKQLKRLVGEL